MTFPNVSLYQSIATSISSRPLRPTKQYLLLACGAIILATDLWQAKGVAL